MPIVVALTFYCAASLAAASAWPSILALCADGSFLLALLLHFLYESLGAGRGGARKECRCQLSAYAKRTSTDAAALNTNRLRM